MKQNMEINYIEHKGENCVYHEKNDYMKVIRAYENCVMLSFEDG